MREEKIRLLFVCLGNMFVLSLSPDRNSIFFVKRQQEKVTEKIFFVPLE